MPNFNGALSDFGDAWLKTLLKTHGVDTRFVETSDSPTPDSHVSHAMFGGWGGAVPQRP